MALPSSITKLAGYTWAAKNFNELELMPDYIAIEEEKPSISLSGLLMPLQSSVTVGRVVKVGSKAYSRGVNVGDEVVYEKWMGGRWEFDIDGESSQKCLIMDVEYVIMKIGEACGD